MRTTPRRLGALFSAVLPLLLGALAPVLAAAKAAARRRPAPPCPGADLRPGDLDAAQVDAATVCLINQIRTADRLAPLRDNSTLRRVAGAEVRLMVRLNYFADVGPSGQTPSRLIASSGYGARAAALATGQNIGWGTTGKSTPARMVAAWMHSRPHRAVILSRSFHDVGVAVAAVLPRSLGRGRIGALYAAEFAAPGR